MTTISLHSDLHLELRKNTTYEQALSKIKEVDILILAGDICKITDVAELIECATQLYPNTEVIFVSGNHEYYHAGDMLVEEDKLRERLKTIDRAHFLQCDSVEIQGIRFLGCTGWSQLSKGSAHSRKRIRDRVNKSINDFRVITYQGRQFTAQDCIDLGDRHRHWLEHELLKNMDKPTVVVTHFAPSIKVRNKRFAVDDITFYFNNSHDDLIMRHSPTYWLFAHTHYNIDQMIGNTRVLSNQHGYGIECPDYKTQFVLEI